MKDAPDTSLYPEWQIAYERRSEKDVGLSFQQFAWSASSGAFWALDDLFVKAGLQFACQWKPDQAHPLFQLWKSTASLVRSYYSALEVKRASPLHPVPARVDFALKVYTGREPSNAHWTAFLPLHEEILALRLCNPWLMYDSAVSSALATMDMAHLMQVGATQQQNPQPASSTAEFSQTIEFIKSRLASTENQLYSMDMRQSELKMEHHALKTKHNESKMEHNELKTEHNELKTEHDELKTEHNALKTKHDALKTQHLSMNSGYDSRHTLLSNELADLRQQFQDFKKSYVRW